MKSIHVSELKNQLSAYLRLTAPRGDYRLGPRAVAGHQKTWFSEFLPVVVARREIIGAGAILR